MKITNKLNLPQPFVDAVQSDYKPREHQYSVTTILNPIRQIILSRRYNDNIVQDVSDMIWLLFGTALHSVLENSKENDTQFKEEYLKQDLGIIDSSLKGYFLSGKADLLDAMLKCMIDYKSTSVYKIKSKEYDDWYKQLLMYAWLFVKIGFEVDNGKIVALLKDWSKTKAKVDRTYPQYPVQVVPFKFTEEDFKYIEQYIKEKFTQIRKYENVPDDELPMCSEEERWNDGTKYAVKKNNNKTAVRVLSTMEEAEQYRETMQNKNPKDKYWVETREGTDTRCLNYCSCCHFCPYYKEKYMKKES